MSSGITEISFGGNGGDYFPNQPIKSIGLNYGDYVNQIKINGENYGGGGGPYDTETIFLDNDEYIYSFVIKSGIYIDFAKFTTNKGKFIQGGGKGGDKLYKSNIVRVIEIGGQSRDYVDKLRIKFIEDYHPSKEIEKEATFILAYAEPNSIIFEYKEDIEKWMHGYELISETMTSKNFSASVEGEYFAKVKAAAEIEMKETNTTTIKSSLKKELEVKKSTRIEHHVSAGNVGIFVVMGTVMQSGEKNQKGEKDFWMFPTRKPSFSEIGIDAIKNVLNCYDMTGVLDIQMQNLTSHKKKRYGYWYYK